MVRELFLKIINFESCDRTLKWEFAYWGGTLNRWYKEGLTRTKGSYREYSYGDCVLGPGCLGNNSLNYNINFWTRDLDVHRYFGFDECITQLPYFYWLYPYFKRKIIYEDDNYIELIDCDGIRKKILRDNSSMPFWLEWPVKNKEDWENIKQERLSLDSINKRFIGDIDIISKNIKKSNALRGIFDTPVGFFGSLRSLIGEVKLYLMYYDNPSLLKDILGHLCNLWLSMAEELTSKIDFDLAIFWEDMAGKQGSLISPAMFKEFLSPYYKRLIGFLKSRGIKYFSVDCDGKVDELIPLFIEAGINIMYPFERQAGNDLIAIRKKYPGLGIIGGFDKNSLYNGKEYIDKELDAISWLIKQGGYIPFADHAIPPNSSWENFKYYRNKLNDIIHLNKVLN
jgi:uroporphyrinogen decarboxylase